MEAGTKLENILRRSKRISREKHCFIPFIHSFQQGNAVVNLPSTSERRKNQSVLQFLPSDGSFGKKFHGDVVKFLIWR